VDLELCYSRAVSVIDANSLESYSVKNIKFGLSKYMSTTFTNPTSPSLFVLTSRP